jgi:group I intron endonuclease
LFVNTSLGAKGGDTLTRSPNREARIACMTKSIVDRMRLLTPEEKKKLFGLSGDKNGMFGRTHSQEARQAISNANKGVTRRSGFTLSNSHRQQISDYAKTRVGEQNAFYGKSHSDATKKKIAETKKSQAILPPNTRKVKIDEVVYESVTDAARKLSISPALVVYRLKGGKYPGYSYII